MSNPHDESPRSDEQNAAARDALRDSDSPPVPAREQTLLRIETTLAQLRGLIETTRREESYQSFSAALVLAVVLQLVVVALAVSALIDWIFQGPLNSLIIKLSFAAFLQIATLTAIVTAQRPRQ